MAKWKAKIEPILTHFNNQGEYDMVNYSNKIINSFGASENNIMQFCNIVSKVNNETAPTPTSSTINNTGNESVCRSFVAMLHLLNDENLEIKNSSTNNNSSSSNSNNNSNSEDIVTNNIVIALTSKSLVNKIDIKEQKVLDSVPTAERCSKKRRKSALLTPNRKRRLSKKSVRFRHKAQFEHD